MPRPQRKITAPSAPAPLPKSLMEAIRADKEAAAALQKPSNPFTRRTSTRQAASSKEYFMSGAKGVRSAHPVTESSAILPPTLQTEETEVVPSSIQSEEAQLARMPSPVKAPSTVQRPIAQRLAMPSANWRTQMTPRMDSSILGNFKRRPRQPSILGIGRQDDSSGLSSLAGGDEDPFYDDLEDFNPVAMSAVRQTKPVQQDSGSPGPRLTSSPPPSLMVRKRKRSEVEEPAEILVQRSSAVSAEEGDDFRGSSPELEAQTQEEVDLSAHGKPRIATSRTTSTSSPEVWSEIMAPPQSSPSDVSEQPIPVASPVKTKRTQHKKTASPLKKPTRQTRAQKSRALQPISSVQLQNLLPARRKKQKPNPDDSLDITIQSSSDLETSLVPTKRARASSKQPKTPFNKALVKKTKGASVLNDKTNTKPIPASALKKNTKASSTKPKRTYTRNRVASGQENDPFALPASSQAYPAESIEQEEENLDVSNSSLADLNSKSRLELNAIVQKFKEVDEWEMEFEEAEGNSSSVADPILG